MSEKEPKKPEVKQPKVIGSFTISLVGNPPKIEVENKGMNPYMLPTLLRQLANNFEEAVLKTRSLIE